MNRKYLINGINHSLYCNDRMYHFLVLIATRNLVLG